MNALLPVSRQNRRPRILKSLCPHANLHQWETAILQPRTSVRNLVSINLGLEDIDDSMPQHFCLEDWNLM
jgi:hypothetical protein